jgi:hypothetical protein
MKLKLLALTSVSILSLAASSVAQVVVNPGFEDPITSDGPPFIGFWEGFNGGAGSSAANSTLMPHTGLQSLQLSIVTTPNTFAGAFQDVAVVAGNGYIFGGWNATTSNPLSVGVEVRIEWRNSGSNTEVSRTANLAPVLGAVYSPFGLTATAPVGADIARIVYAIQSFSTAPLGNGTVYMDDVSLTLVPEPSAMALLGLGGLALTAMRRRRA